ncbi:MAG: DUF2065 domain-containing protein [Candidatus Competibacterales bacterium]|nr:DUF2065 domain-containing protein [Candidatus Competibacterales bacterium]
MWQDLLAAIGLMLVLEGILPFLSPMRLKRSLIDLARLDNRTLRVIGLVSMLTGLAVLYWLR